MCVRHLAQQVFSLSTLISQSYCFGFGRRICPGMHLGDAVVWTYLAKAAAALHISKFVGPDGKEMEPTCDQTPGVVSYVFLHC